MKKTYAKIISLAAITACGMLVTAITTSGPAQVPEDVERMNSFDIIKLVASAYWELSVAEGTPIRETWLQKGFNPQHFDIPKIANAPRALYSDQRFCSQSQAFERLVRRATVGYISPDPFVESVDAAGAALKDRHDYLFMDVNVETSEVGGLTFYRRATGWPSLGSLFNVREAQTPVPGEMPIKRPCMRQAELAALLAGQYNKLVSQESFSLTTEAGVKYSLARKTATPANVVVFETELYGIPATRELDGLVKAFNEAVGLGSKTAYARGSDREYREGKLFHVRELSGAQVKPYSLVLAVTTPKDSPGIVKVMLKVSRESKADDSDKPAPL